MKAIILTENANIIHNADAQKLYITGILTKCIYAPLVTKDASGKERTSKECYYQLSIHTTAPDEAIRAEILSAYYKDTEDQFRPKWLKEGAADEDGKLYINLKSLYDLRYFVPDDANGGGEYNRMSFDDLQEVFGSAPLGSTVVVSIRCKEGALYADALKFLNVKTVSVDDYFM